MQVELRESLPIRNPTGTSAMAAIRPLQVVFSAECNSLFDWHSIAILYSSESSNFSQSANLTRLLACSEAERQKYPQLALDIGPTFVHRTLRDDPLVDANVAYVRNRKWEKCASGGRHVKDPTP